MLATPFRSHSSRPLPRWLVRRRVRRLWRPHLLRQEVRRQDLWLRRRRWERRLRELGLNPERRLLQEVRRLKARHPDLWQALRNRLSLPQ